MITTIEDAYAFVREVKICTIFAQNTVYASLWEQVDLPDRQPGEKGELRTFLNDEKNEKPLKRREFNTTIFARKESLI